MFVTSVNMYLLKYAVERTNNHHLYLALIMNLNLKIQAIKCSIQQNRDQTTRHG